jgi:hypothetical protein
MQGVKHIKTTQLSNSKRRAFIKSDIDRPEQLIKRAKS